MRGTAAGEGPGYRHLSGLACGLPPEEPRIGHHLRRVAQPILSRWRDDAAHWMKFLGHLGAPLSGCFLFRICFNVPDLCSYVPVCFNIAQDLFESMRRWRDAGRVGELWGARNKRRKRRGGITLSIARGAAKFWPRVTAVGRWRGYGQSFELS